MSDQSRPTDYEAFQEALDPHRREELERAMMESSSRLRDAGMSLTGRESSEELVSLLEAVERFEHAVKLHGGDLMVDEGPHGKTTQPDDVHFTLPRRRAREPIAEYASRVDAATQALHRHRPHSG